MSSFRSSFIHFAQGLLMGGSDVIPGVSGGTMALIVGIYRRLVKAISILFAAALALIRLDVSAFRKQFLSADWRLLIPLAIGIASAIVVASAIIPALLDAYPQQMRGLFFGLVAASIAVPWLRLGRMTASLFALALVAAVIAFFIAGLPAFATATDPSFLRIFLSAAIAICAMILPGVSGAFLLEVMGIYRPTLEALRSVFALDGGGALYVITFIAGAAIGLGVFATFLTWLLNRFHDRTMAILIGLMAGALRALWPWITEDNELLWPGPADPVTSVLLLFAVGFLFVAILTWFSADQLRNQGEEDRAPQTVNN